MLPFILALAGAVLGAASGALTAAILGYAAGVLWKRLGEMSARQTELTSDHRALRTRQELLLNEVTALKRRVESEAPSPPTVHTPAAPAAPPEPASQPSAVPAAPETGPPPTPVRRPVPESTPERAIPPIPRPAAAGAPAPPQTPDSLTAAARWMVEFFTTGNVVAKVGMIVVFFGVAFLLRYAAERGLFPIEYRLMGAAAGALALLAIGWGLRHTRSDYAIVLQGGAVGLLYLTIFAAFRLYGLLPGAFAFALLLVVVAFSAMLAVVQSAMSLAVLGTSGGFLAPILASTGGGSHVALFSYYAVLDAGVVAIAWFRAWRFLNWLAFVFTFGIGLLWGQAEYEPALFATTEPFLVLFFLMFLAVAVLFAHRQPPQLRGYIDGTLVFGAPAIAFGMQSVLVRDIPFGRAYSAVALAALYLALTRALWRRDAVLRPLAEAFLALAVVFLILAVPLAFDGHATAAAWALEGAGLVWIGVRQHRQLARLVGSALLIGSGVAFGVMAAPPASAMAVLNTRFLGCAAIAAGSLAAGRLLSRARDSAGPIERVLEWVLLVWGLLWWLGAVMVEIATHAPDRVIPSALLLGFAISFLIAAVLARRWQWRAMALTTMAVGPISWMWVVPLFLTQGSDGPLPDLGWLAWPAALAVSYLLLFWFERVWPRLAVRTGHAATAWLLVFLVAWSLVVATREAVPESPTWAFAIWGLVPIAFVLALRRVGPRLPWPVRRFTAFYAAVVPAAPIAAALAWVVWACGQDGSAAPLPYVPVLNPLELTQALALIVAYQWRRDIAANRTLRQHVGPVLQPMLGVIAFLALNAAVGRIVHALFGVPYEIEALLRSSVFQTGISILWGATAGALMTFSRLRLERPVWMAGAGLLAALIVKLFLVDLGNVGGVARIVSFLATGVLILLIGYFAPVPPRAARSEAEQTS